MKKQIVVIEGGWVFIGEVSVVEGSIDNGDLIIRSAQNIRKWGTTRGLGEIALSGPPTDCILDQYGVVRVPRGQVLFTIDCT